MIYQLTKCRACPVKFLVLDFLPWRKAGYCSETCAPVVKKEKPQLTEQGSLL